jgi:hypothetical protein
MSSFHRTRMWRSGLAATAVLAVCAGAVAATPGPGTVLGPAGPEVRLIAATRSVVLDRYPGEPGIPPGVYLDLGTYLAVDGGPLEFRVNRPSYKQPLVARQYIRSGGTTTVRDLPGSMVRDFAGLKDFIRVTLTDGAGRRVAERKEGFCPNNAAGRLRPDAPAVSRYPHGCFDSNPFVLGAVWGVERGWAANTYAGEYAAPLDVPAGEYTAAVSVTEPYRRLLGMAAKGVTVKVTVRDAEVQQSAARSAAHSGHGAHDAHGSHGGHADHRAGRPVPAALHGDSPAPPALPWALKRRGPSVAQAGDGPGRTDGSRLMPALRPAERPPSGRESVPDVPKPDLRSLPARDIAVSRGEPGDPAGDYLVFSATVWNAGPAALVVDGFRAPGEDLMDAYQYFYDAGGKQIGYTRTGTMEWDPRSGHEHWHFTDFASYRLLKADRKEAVRSGKEAFCLANTDVVDYTVKNANWHPYNTDLSTACGQRNSVSVREVLDVGSGDTYTQIRPGQSFDITDLPNGTYYIQVLANPEKRLRETDTGNNSAYRKVVLGGTPGARTVSVPPHDLIVSP